MRISDWSSDVCSSDQPVLPQADRVSHHAGSRKGRCLMPWTREQMAAQAARELQDGFYVNLGIGIPTLVANFVPIDIEVVLQSENGMLGLGPFPYYDEVDPDLINSGKYIERVVGEERVCTD